MCGQKYHIPCMHCPFQPPITMLSFSHVGACGARVSPSATLLLAIDGPAAAAKVWEQRRRRRNRPRLEKGWEVLDFMGVQKPAALKTMGSSSKTAYSWMILGARVFQETSISLGTRRWEYKNWDIVIHTCVIMCAYIDSEDSVIYIYIHLLEIYII